MIELNEQQKKILKEAVQWFRYGTDQVFEIQGPAGTGKSVLIYHILRELGLNADQYMPMAYTGQASIVMRTKGFPTAKSIHSSLYEVIEVEDRSGSLAELFGRPRKKTVWRKRLFLEPSVRLFFIDEAYMVPENMVHDILSFGIKVLVCGDCRQLPPIGGKPAFLTNPSKTHHLTELMRQAKDNPIVYLSQRAINGDPIHCGSYGDNVLVIEDTDLIDPMFGYANVVLTGTNKTRYMVNSYIRNKAGYVSKMPYMFERLICRNNNWNLQLDGIAMANGLNGTVTSIVDPLKFDGNTFYINFKPDLSNAIFFEVPVDYDYFICDFGKKQEYRDDPNMRKYMRGNMFEYAYSITTHLSQGSEYDNGIIIEEFLRPQIQRQLLYTAITRFKKSMILVKKSAKDLYLP